MKREFKSDLERLRNLSLAAIKTGKSTSNGWWCCLDGDERKECEALLLKLFSGGFAMPKKAGAA